MNVTNSWNSKCEIKNGVIGLVYMLLSVTLNCQSLCFFEILADVSKSKPVETIYVNLKVLAVLLQKMVLFVIQWRTFQGILALEVEDRVNFLLSWHFFDILILNIPWTVSQTTINLIIFWKWDKVLILW